MPLPDLMNIWCLVMTFHWVSRYQGAFTTGLLVIVISMPGYARVNWLPLTWINTFHLRLRTRFWRDAYRLYTPLPAFCITPGSLKIPHIIANFIKDAKMVVSHFAWRTHHGLPLASAAGPIWQLASCVWQSLNRHDTALARHGYFNTERQCLRRHFAALRLGAISPLTALACRNGIGDTPRNSIYLAGYYCFITVAHIGL
jgi:hypothetical protein